MVTTSFPRQWGDASGAFVASLATGLTTAGVGVTVLAPATPGSRAEEDWKGVRVVRVGNPGRSIANEPGGILPALASRPWRALAVPHLVGALETAAKRLAHEADVVHGQWIYPGGIVAVRAAEAADRPSVITCHGADINLARWLPPLRWLVRSTIRRSGRTLAVSEAMRDGAVALGADPSGIMVVPLGVVPSEAGVSDAAASRFADRGGIRLVMVGSLTRRKGADILLEAVARCGNRGRLSVAFVGDGPRRPSLVRQVRELGLTDRVEFAGTTSPDRVPAWIRAADMLVLPSRAEGLGLVCVEAMMEGRPVIAADIPGPRELVRHEESGLRFPSGNAAALAASIDRLAGDEGLRDRFGARGRELIELEGRTMAASVARHVAIYHQLVRQG